MKLSSEEDALINCDIYKKFFYIKKSVKNIDYLLIMIFIRNTLVICTQPSWVLSFEVEGWVLARTKLFYQFFFGTF